jgi:parallel beta-helix repeat protein
MNPDFLARLFVAAVLLAGRSAQAACDLVLGAPNALTPADTIAWSGCSGSGTGVQSALDFVAEAGGGSVKLSGAGSLLVGSPLRVRNRTMLYGDPARSPYGMVVVGDNADGACNPGPAYRDRDCPVIQVFGQTASPVNGANITIYNLHIDGATPGRPLNNAISVQHSNKVSIVYNRISGARWKGIEDANTVETMIDYLWLEMVRRTGPDPETGGAGVWLSRSANTTLQHSIITSPTYFDTGVPDWDVRHGPNAAATMDLVSALGTTGTRIVGNTISASNAAGIYLAADLEARVSGALVANNTVANFRQHGIDLANCDHVDVTGNTVINAGDAGVSIADCHFGYFQGNTIAGAAQNTSYYSPRGSFMLNWGSKDNTITGNDVRAGHNAEYSVYTASDNPEYGKTLRNAFTCNNLTSGSMGVFGGELSGKTAPALDRTNRPFRCLPMEAAR